MMREKILAALLIISICTNVYLVFFDHSSVDGGVGQLINIHVNPALANHNLTGELNTTDRKSVV